MKNSSSDALLAKQIGKTIRDLRKEKGLSQSELGAILFTGQDTVSLWELGKRLPDLINLVELSKYFGVSADYILGLE